MQPSERRSGRSGSGWTLQDPGARMSKGLGYLCQHLHWTKALKTQTSATRKPLVSSAESKHAFINIFLLDCEVHQAACGTLTGAPG